VSAFGHSPFLYLAFADAFEGHLDGLDGAVCVEDEAVDAGDAVVAVGLFKGAAVVDDVVFVLAWHFDNAVVACSASDTLVALEDFTFEFEGAEGTVADGVSYAIVGTSPTSLTPHEVVSAVSLQHERPLDIILAGRNLVELLSVLPRNDGKEVGTQTADVAVSPAAVKHIELSVVVAEDELVDGLCAIDNLINKRLAECILIRAFGLVADGNADAAHLAFVNIIAAEEEVELIVCLDDGRCPERTTEPRNVCLRNDILVLCPVDEVFAGESVEVQLLVVGRTKGRKDPVLAVKDSAFGVGIPTLEDGIAAGLFLLCVSGAEDTAQSEDNKHQFIVHSS